MNQSQLMTHICLSFRFCVEAIDMVNVLIRQGVVEYPVDGEVTTLGVFPGVGPEGGAIDPTGAGAAGGAVGQGGGAGQGNAIYGYSPTVMLPAETDGLLTSGLRQSVGKNPSIPTLGTITGILTNPQFRLIIRALERRDGVDLLSAPKKSF